MPKHKLGRPRIKDHRDVRVVLLLTESEFDALEAQPECIGMHPNALARLWVLAELKRRRAK